MKLSNIFYSANFLLLKELKFSLLLHLKSLLSEFVLIHYQLFLRSHDTFPSIDPLLYLRILFKWFESSLLKIT